MQSFATLVSLKHQLESQSIEESNVRRFSTALLGCLQDDEFPFSPLNEPEVGEEGAEENMIIDPVLHCSFPQFDALEAINTMREAMDLYTHVQRKIAQKVQSFKNSLTPAAAEVAAVAPPECAEDVLTNIMKESSLGRLVDQREEVIQVVNSTKAQLHRFVTEGIQNRAIPMVKRLLDDVISMLIEPIPGEQQQQIQIQPIAKSELESHLSTFVSAENNPAAQALTFRESEHEGEMWEKLEWCLKAFTQDMTLHNAESLDRVCEDLYAHLKKREKMAETHANPEWETSSQAAQQLLLRCRTFFETEFSYLKETEKFVMDAIQSTDVQMKENAMGESFGDRQRLCAHLRTYFKEFVTSSRKRLAHSVTAAFKSRSGEEPMHKSKRTEETDNNNNAVVAAAVNPSSGTRLLDKLDDVNLLEQIMAFAGLLSHILLRFPECGDLSWIVKAMAEGFNTQNFTVTKWIAVEAFLAQKACSIYGSCDGKTEDGTRPSPIKFSGIGSSLQECARFLSLVNAFHQFDACGMQYPTGPILPVQRLKLEDGGNALEAHFEIESGMQSIIEFMESSPTAIQRQKAVRAVAAAVASLHADGHLTVNIPGTCSGLLPKDVFLRRTCDNGEDSDSYVAGFLLASSSSESKLFERLRQKRGREDTGSLLSDPTYMDIYNLGLAIQFVALHGSPVLVSESMVAEAVLSTFDSKESTKPPPSCACIARYLRDIPVQSAVAATASTPCRVISTHTPTTLSQPMSATEHAVVRDPLPLQPAATLESQQQKRGDQSDLSARSVSTTPPPAAPAPDSAAQTSTCVTPRKAEWWKSTQQPKSPAKMSSAVAGATSATSTPLSHGANVEVPPWAVQGTPQAARSTYTAPVHDSFFIKKMGELLLKTDHCKKLVSSSRGFQISSISKVVNPVLWHAYTAKKEELLLQNSGQPIPLVPVLVKPNANDAQSLKSPRRTTGTPSQHSKENMKCCAPSVESVGCDPYVLSRLFNQSLPSYFPPLEPLLDEDNMNEVYLIHGTSEVAAEAVVHHGFDERVAKCSGMFGAGTYFTNTLCKAHMYAKPSITPFDSSIKTSVDHSPSAVNSSVGSNTCGSGGCRVLIVSRVLLGDAFVTDKAVHGLRRPPSKASVDTSMAKQATKDPFAMYDSVIGNGKDHKEFVIYDRHMAYPEFVIRYTSS